MQTLESKQILFYQCYAFSNAATDVASKGVSVLRVTLSRGVSMEYCGVHNCRYVELGKALLTDLHPYD